ncbi:separin [Nephila pilipes]|uniref:separase n=1 Tax=Nephila pilipes TaxID=299642 RepID=A0A8X6QNI1_NEPPI|nr:separin [Nephila pilipes]
MATVKTIINNLKNEDIFSLMEDIQILYKDFKISCAETCLLLKAIYQLMSMKEETKKDDSYNTILKVIPCINLCMDYVKNSFSNEEAVKHQFSPILYHIIKLLLKFDLYCPALACAEQLKMFLSDKQQSLKDKEACAKNLSALFWNEALQIEKKNNLTDFEMGFKFRSMAVEFMLIEDKYHVIDQKISLTLVRYCHNNEERNPKNFVSFLQNIWKKSYFQSIDYDHTLHLFKLLYSVFEISLKHCKEASVLKCLFSLLSDLSNNLEEGEKKHAFKTCIEIAKISVQLSLHENFEISKKIVTDFQKIIKYKKNHTDFEINLHSYACGFFYLSFVWSINLNEICDKSLSLFITNIKLYVALVNQYLSVSSEEYTQKCFPFCLKSDFTICSATVNMFNSVIKKEQNAKKRQEHIDEVKKFVESSLNKFKLANITNEFKTSHTRYASTIGNIGCILYNAGLYFESIYFLKVNCDVYSKCISVDDVQDLKASLYKKKEILIYCYLLSGNHRTALSCTVELMLIFKNKQKECMELWRKVKRDALRIDDLISSSCTISDLLSEMNITISTEEEAVFLMNELKVCKMEKYCSEEVISICTKLLNFPSTQYHRASVILEVLTMSPSITEKISEIANKSTLEMCLESINLFKDCLVENPMYNEAKLLLSVCYFCLYCLKLQQLHKVAAKEMEIFLRSGSDDEENETCDIKPAFPLLTFLVEAEIVSNLELALEIWTDISKNSNDNWSNLADIIRDWDLLTIIQATAEFFSSSAYDISELKSWILLRNIASSVKNKEYEFIATISLINFLIKLGYLDISYQLLKLIENDSMLNGSSISLILIELKLQLAKSDYYLQKGMFDDGLTLLRNILQNPVFEKKMKHVKMLQIQSLMLQTDYLLVPSCAFADSENSKYLQNLTAVTSAMECAVLTKGLLKVMLEKQSSESNNDFISFKALLLKNLLKAFLLLGEQYFQIGDPRFARCYLKEGLKIAEGHILTYWASRMLIVLGKIDLLCNNVEDCLVKLNGLKYIMDEDSNKNTSVLLSKAYAQTRISNTLNTSEDFEIHGEIKLKLERNIKQNFINSQLHASPVSTKIENSRFEVKFESYFDGSMTSIFLLKLEIWALSCFHLIADDKALSAKSQLSKLLQRFEVLKKRNRNISEVLVSAKLGIPSSITRNPSKSEVILSTSILLKLSLLHFSDNDIKGSEDLISIAFKSLVESSEKEKYIFPAVYAQLKYHQIVMNLKNILGLKANVCLESNVCPSVQSISILSRKVVKSEKTIIENMNTPKKCRQSCTTPLLNTKRFHHAPTKKDIIPKHLRKDVGVTKLSHVSHSLIFSSSEDEKYSITPDISVSQKITSMQKKPETLSYTVSESKRIFSSKNIEASCDVWKFDLSSPEVSAENNKSKISDNESKILRSSRLKVKNGKFNNNCLKLPHKKNTKQMKGKAKKALNATNSETNSVEDSDVLNSNIYSNERFSVEYNRSSSKNRLKSDSVQNNLCEDVFYLDNSENSNEKKDVKMCELPQEDCHFLIDELSKNFNSLDISAHKSIISIPAEKLKKSIDELEFIRLLIEHNAPYPLYIDISRLLAVLIMIENETSIKSPSRVSICAYLLSETFSSPLRQIHLSNVLYFKEKLIKDERNCIPATLKRTNRSINAQIDYLLSSVPKDYTIIQITALNDEELKGTSFAKFRASRLIICRYEPNTPPLIMCLDSSSAEMFNSSLFTGFENVLKESTLIMKQNDDSKKWWKTRSSLDLRLKTIVEDMEDKWLGCWKGLILSKCTNQDRVKQLVKISETLSKIKVPSDKNLLLVLLDSVMHLSRAQLSSAVCHLWNCNQFDEVYSKIYKSILDLSLELPATERHPLILILDKNIQALPWESLPLLKDIPVSRMPSLSLLSSKFTIMANKMLLYKEIDCSKTFYILNPSGDLKYSQEYFQPLFEKQVKWKGIAGRAPDSQECTSAFKSYDLFVYCGHGSGRQYLEGTSIDTMKCFAATILMGCSSGRLKQLNRQLEAYGVPLTYLVNGCPCVVGNLWDVTDKDIDRFTDKLFKLFIPNYSQEETSTINIATAVSQARNACKMRYLVGAAPIIYGLPVLARS